MKVQGVSVNSANVHYNNSSEESRVYDIEANVAVQGTKVNSFDNGVVKKNGITMATFSAWSAKVNPTFQGIDTTEKCAVMVAIDEFIASVKEAVTTQVIGV